MQIGFKVSEYTVTEDMQFFNDPLEENKNFPVLSIGVDSYVGEGTADAVIDKDCVYNVQIGRYTSIADRLRLLVDLNHDYKCVGQGRVNGVKYSRPKRIKRKGQIVIMNDCWIGSDVTILGGVTVGNGAVVAAGSVVTKDVMPYSIVAGNPAKVIGYRFNESQIEKLNVIRWWNWSHETIVSLSDDIFGDVDEFIRKYYSKSKLDLMNVESVDFEIMHDQSLDGKVFLYIPDFEQDYPSYPRVIDSFAKAYSDTNNELLLYIRDDDFLDDKIELLNALFQKYEEYNCFINLYIGNVEDERSLFCNVDGYVTNRSVDNVYHMDLASLYGISIISGVDIPVFLPEREVSGFVKVKPATNDQSNESFKNEMISIIKSLVDAQNGLGKSIEDLSLNDKVVDSAFDNIKYELYDVFKKNASTFIYPKIEPTEITIEKIMNGKSICRFGDGEFAIMSGKNRQKFQLLTEKLQRRLIEVFESRDDNIIIGIADVYGSLEKYNTEGKYGIRFYLTEEVRKEHYSFIDMNRVYADAYITRPFLIHADNNTDAPKKRFDELKKIWHGKKLLIIEGEKTRMGVGNDLFENAKDIKRVLCPAECAFDRYDDILSFALEQDKDCLVLIALGPTASVLAYDMAKAGFHALDIGHIDIEYEWMLAGKGERVNIPNKYVNEVVGGDRVEDFVDEEYEKQIIESFL